MTPAPSTRWAAAPGRARLQRQADALGEPGQSTRQHRQSVQFPERGWPACCPQLAERRVERIQVGIGHDLGHPRGRQPGRRGQLANRNPLALRSAANRLFRGMADGNMQVRDLRIARNRQIA